MIINVIGHGSGYEQGYEAEGEVWCINYWTPKTTRLFNIHPEDHEYYIKNIRDIENAKVAGTPVDTNELCHFLQAAFIYPDRIDYFGSSTDYAIAAAIMTTGVAEIHLWGVTMDDKGDHYEKRCATDFWCGVAIGRGIKVVVHGNSTVMTTADGLSYGTFQPMKRQFKQI